MASPVASHSCTVGLYIDLLPKRRFRRTVSWGTNQSKGLYKEVAPPGQKHILIIISTNRLRRWRSRSAKCPLLFMMPQRGNLFVADKFSDKFLPQRGNLLNQHKSNLCYAGFASVKAQYIILMYKCATQQAML